MGSPDKVVLFFLSYLQNNIKYKFTVYLEGKHREGTPMEEELKLFFIAGAG